MTCRGDRGLLHAVSALRFPWMAGLGWLLIYRWGFACPYLGGRRARSSFSSGNVPTTSEAGGERPRDWTTCQCFLKPSLLAGIKSGARLSENSSANSFSVLEFPNFLKGGNGKLFFAKLFSVVHRNFMEMGIFCPALTSSLFVHEQSKA